MFHSNAGVMSQLLPITSLPMLVLVNVTVVFTHAVSLGLIVKSVLPARLTTIGRMVLPLVPQGFSTSMFAEKLFW